MADLSTRLPSLLWAFLGLDGRVGREIFWLGQVAAGILGYLILHPYYDDNGLLQFSNLALSPIVFAAIGWVGFALSVKRLHDLNLTGWLAGLVFVPFVGIVPFLAIGVMPGVRAPNIYGPATNARGPL